MKAILVIDVPYDMNIKETRALYISLTNGLFIKDMSVDIPLKPLPQKYDIGKMREQKGWNACLDEILGETE